MGFLFNRGELEQGAKNIATGQACSNVAARFGRKDKTRCPRMAKGSCRGSGNKVFFGLKTSLAKRNSSKGFLCFSNVWAAVWV